MDGIAFNRDAMKRMRRAAERAADARGPAASGRRPVHFDNHPNNKTAVYIEMLPYFDSIWVGDFFLCDAQKLDRLHDDQSTHTGWRTLGLFAGTRALPSQPFGAALWRTRADAQW